MIRRHLIFHISWIVLVISCSKKNEDYTVETDFFSFKSIEQCKVVVQKEREETKFRIMFSDTTIKVFCLYGEFVNDLTEHEPRFIISDSLYNLYTEGKISSESGIYYIREGQKIELDRYRKQNVFFDTLNGLVRKITLPRQVGNGITGVYFGDIGIKNRLNPVRFSMYGENLSAKYQKLLENIFDTIKF